MSQAITCLPSRILIQWLTFVNDRCSRHLQRRQRGDSHPIFLFSRILDLRYIRPREHIWNCSKIKKVMAVIPENRQNITITILVTIPTITVVLPTRISNEDRPCLLRLPQWLAFANGSASRCPRYWLNAGILTPFPCSAPKPDLCLYGAGASGRIYLTYYSSVRTKMQ